MNKGLTIVEMLVASVMAGIIILGLGVVLVETQRRWEESYEQVNGDMVTDSYAAKRAFESMVRESSLSMMSPKISSDGSSIVLYTYKDINSNRIDAYAKFYLENGELVAEYGPLEELTDKWSSWLQIAYDFRSAFWNASLSVTGTELNGDSNMTILTTDAVSQLEEAAFANLLSGAVSSELAVSNYNSGRQVLARNVKTVDFSVHGATVRMILTMEKDDKTKQLYCSAVRRSG
ncbi:MAG: hypothetical protein WC374_11335 [Phycisphaerae bacterium]|jgi:hypothetical protein